MTKKNNFLGKESLAEKIEKIKNEIDIKESKNEPKKKYKGAKKIKKIDQTKDQSTKNKIAPKLFISGRLDRKKHAYTAKSLILLSQLEEEIKTYCRGGDLVVLNYLIKEGLKKIKASGTTIHIDIEELLCDI